MTSKTLFFWAGWNPYKKEWMLQPTAYFTREEAVAAIPEFYAINNIRTKTFEYRRVGR